jgi:hypothetical protein
LSGGQVSLLDMLTKHLVKIKIEIIERGNVRDVSKLIFLEETCIKLLKGQCHEIFDPRFFRQSIIPRPQINTLKYFRILFRIHRDIRP